jgi:hypothetical protein
MNKFLIVAIVIIVIGIGGFFLFNKPSSQPFMQTTSVSKDTIQPEQNQPVDYQATFAIYTNGVFRIFTAAMYHNLSEEVYIQSDNPNLVHVKKSGITWDDFFKTLPFSVTKKCLITGTKETFCSNQTKTLKFYLNGVQNDNLLEAEIKPNDKTLITYGSETDLEIAKQLEELSSIF